MGETHWTRRQFGAAVTAAALAGPRALAVGRKSRPAATHGVASGDVTDTAAVIWSRADRPSRMVVEYSTRESFADSRRVVGPAALAADDFTAKVDLRGLPAGETIHYRVRFQDLAKPTVTSEPVAGRLRLAPAGPRDVHFCWGGDTAGQGWGINPNFGGMIIYDAIRRRSPDFFVHSGDCIYADGPIEKHVKLDDGTAWHNLVTEEKSKVAETLDEFRGNYRYNLLDEPLKAMQAAVPVFAQWDDHETCNNWFPGEVIDDPRYGVKSASLLAARAKRAFLDYTPLRANAADPERVYRGFRFGPMLELLFIDKRSHRGPNTANRQKAAGPETALLGKSQMAWLKRRLRASKSTWKVIASDMPLGLRVPDRRDGKLAWENAANGDGPALGRELEIAELLKFIKVHKVRNVVWLTADVHYAAAHHYDPAAAAFTDFDPFWEFVAGPLNAGTFGPNELDNTFGPRVKFMSLPPGTKPNRPPTEQLQFFGSVRIDGKTREMAVSLHDITGRELYGVTLPPAA